MMSLLRSVPLLFLFAFWPISSAQTFDPLSSENEDIIREKNQGSSEIPDGIAFRNVAQMVRTFAAEDEYGAAAWLQAKIGISEEDANAMVLAMMAESNLLDSQIREYSRQMACHPDAENMDSEEQYQVLDAIDDGVEVITEQRFSMYSDSLSDENAGRLQAFVGIEKANMAYVKFDHKKMYMKRGLSPAAEFVNMCSAIEASSAGAQE